MRWLTVFGAVLIVVGIGSLFVNVLPFHHREEVEAAGGRVVSVPVLPGYSTSAILRKIREGTRASRADS